ncbi:MAG: DUF1365 domain-containing protein [Candidatus Solibacter sp.]|nr:DUF1365 domain-containing protein [Candidatus Solibacter sp.]
MLAPGVYFGSLRHRRFTPRKHEFTYGVFLALLDIDRIPELMRVSPLVSYNRWNWASFDERDHFGDPRLPLRERLARDAEANGLRLPAGPVYLLTHLRYLGYCFNPISLFYCHDQDGRLEMVLAEVCSTFGERHNYWLSAANELPAEHSRRYQVPKRMHVSPFMDMAMDYAFALTAPGDRLTAHMSTIEHGRSIFDATLNLKREAWSAKSLHRALWRHPWMTAKVIAAIHWEALRLWGKRVPVFTHPARRGQNV